MSAAKEQRLVVGGTPRVDLMPPEVHARRQDARLNRLLVLVLVAVVALSGLTILGAKAVADGSAGRLADAQSRTTQLLAQQRRFGEVSTVKARLAATTAARTAVAGAVIDWRSYLRSVSATLPTGVSVVGATVEAVGTGTGAASAAAAGATAPTGTVATLTLQVRTTRWGAVQDWLTALPALRGFLDAAPTTVSRDPQTGVLATVVVHVGAKAYSAPTAETVPAVTVPADPTPAPSAAPSADATSSPSPTTAAPTTTATTPPAARTPAPSPSSGAPLAAGRTGGNG